MQVPIILYFGNVSREPIGIIKKELRSLAPPYSVWCIDFVGASVLEILTTETKYRVFGYDESTGAHAVVNKLTTRKPSDKTPPVEAAELEHRKSSICILRAQRIAQRHDNSHVQNYYDEIATREDNCLGNGEPRICPRQGMRKEIEMVRETHSKARNIKRKTENPSMSVGIHNYIEVGTWNTRGLLHGL